jgi:NDP-sugar pyrophosphorylase family protein
MSAVKTAALYDLTHTRAGEYLKNTTYPHEALADIGKWILSIGAKLDKNEFDHPCPDVWIAKSAKVAPGASITGPCIIDEESEVRHCAFIRGNALVGKGAVVGNSTELKNVILFDGVQVPHYNYVGDSILGYKAHMGAGSICSNLKSDCKPVVIHGDEDIVTGLRKIGGILADYADAGCGCVINPGTVIGKRTTIYPLTALRGVYPADCIVKSTNIVVERKENA